ncbi:prepilin-type N-terminal cleavage/methylation domain-containing protein [Virgibacillus sp. L01]|uniref:prepilin-type N-terminal cleavage/methylation domain-containing protein n=1 Tax=Virgibacillus sp. L01 TaxID=3457429 RepID=UPI003FD45493
MLERMKKMMKKEKGFTLVELLAVIAILAIIVAIAVPTIGNVIGESEKKAHDANVELIKNAARLADVSGNYGKDDTITLNQLKKKGYLDEVPTVPGTDTKYSGTVTKDGNGKFEYGGDESVD